MRTVFGGDYLITLAPLDSTDTSPLYRQVEARIVDAVRAGRLRQGQQLPVGAVARRYRIALDTAHRALRVAADQGAVRIVAGAGAFVCPPARPEAVDR